VDDADVDLGAASGRRWGSDREIALRKPPGMESERPAGARGPARMPTGLDLVRERLGWPEARLPHRLDRIACGWLLACRDAATVAARNESVRAGDWIKGYVARVAMPSRGPASLLGEHLRYLRRDGRLARIVRSGGDPSRLAILAAEAAPDRPGEAHVAIRLDTGRYHQIRAMLAGGAPGAMYLEHAWLAHPSIDDGVRVVDWRPGDPGREPVDPSLVAALSARS